MKFSQLSAFEKNLASLHLSPVYLVVSPCSYERKKIMELIKAAVRKKEGEVTLARYDGKDVEWAAVREDLDTLNGWGGGRIILLDEIDKLKKAALSALIHYVSQPSPHVYLIMGANSGKSLLELYKQGKKEMVACDLSEEKPWERKDRLRNHLQQLSLREKKQMSREAAELLLDKLGTDLSSLEQEMNKLICYCWDRPQITPQDVRALCYTHQPQSVWNLAEGIVWNTQPVRVDSTYELSSFFYLLGQVRFHLQQGLILASAFEQGKPVEEVSLKPQLLEKVIPYAKKQGSRHFQQALNNVFEMELLAKNSSLAVSLLFDLLVAKVKPSR